MKRRMLMAIAVLPILIGLVGHDASGQGPPRQTPGVIARMANYRGYSYSQWQAIWWQTVFAIPAGDFTHPFFTAQPFEGPNGVLFLVGVFGEGNVVDITIPAGSPLFFPILNAECSVFEPDPFHGDNEAELRECANAHIDATSGVFATIDGKPVNNVLSYRTESPLFQWGPLPEDNIFAFFGYDAPAGTTSDAMDVGYYLMITPLSVGQHVIHFGGTFGDGSQIDTIYRIRVVR